MDSTREGNGGLLDTVELAEAEHWLDSPDAPDLGVGDLPALVKASAAAYQDELDQERRRRIEAEWREAQAELAQLRATAEEYFDRAIVTGRRKGAIGRDTWQTRSAALSAEANRLLSSAYDLHRKLRNHPGAPPKTAALTRFSPLRLSGRMASVCLYIVAMRPPPV